MKALFPVLAVFAAIGISTPLYAAGDHGMNHAGSAHAATAAPRSEGTVTKVDKAGGKITIKHGPLQNLGMPGMTMAFKAATADMLDQVQPGDTVRFLAENVDGAFTVTEIEVTP